MVLVPATRVLGETVRVTGVDSAVPERLVEAQVPAVMVPVGMLDRPTSVPLR